MKEEEAEEQDDDGIVYCTIHIHTFGPGPPSPSRFSMGRPTVFAPPFVKPINGAVCVVDRTWLPIVGGML